MVVSQLVSAVIAVVIGFSLIAAARIFLTILSQALRLTILVGFCFFLARAAFPSVSTGYEATLPQGIHQLVSEVGAWASVLFPAQETPDRHDLPRQRS